MFCCNDENSGSREERIRTVSSILDRYMYCFFELREKRHNYKRLEKILGDPSITKEFRKETDRILCVEFQEIEILERELSVYYKQITDFIH